MQSYLLELAFSVCELLLPRQQCSVDTATKTNRYRDREQKMRKLGDKQSGRCTQRPYRSPLNIISLWRRPCSR